MRNRAGMTWIVIWMLVAQLVLVGPAPAWALSSPSPAVSPSVLGLTDLGVSSANRGQPFVLPFHYLFPVQNSLGLALEPSVSPLTWTATPDKTELQQRVLAALYAEEQAGLEGPETLTDDEGFYRFEGLPLGTHKVTIDVETLPAHLWPAADEAPIVLWVTPGMEEVSDALSTGVRFTVRYDDESGELSGYVFWDQDADGLMGADEAGLPGVRVVDPTMHQYFVPFDDAHLWELFVAKAQCHTAQGENHVPCLPMVSNIFVAAGSDGTIVYYDHWEDSYDLDPVNPVTGGTTIVEVLDAGATKIFTSNIDPGDVGSGPPYYYDGRDRITIVGEDANVIRLVNASGYSKNGPSGCTDRVLETTSGWLAAAWEVPEVAEWGTEYHTIAGEDLGPEETIQDHNFAGLEVMAWRDGTLLTYNVGGATLVTRTLNAGDTYFVPGENGGDNGNGVKSNSLITTTKPVQVQMMTGGCGEDPRIVSAHGYTLIPRRSWGRAYWSPVPGFSQIEDPYCANDPPVPDPPRDDRTQWFFDEVDTDIYLHNPSFEDRIEVTIESGAQSETVTIDQHSTVSVLAATGWSDLAVGTAGTYLYSDQDFWGLVVVDSATQGSTGSDDFDWGYSLLPESGLSSQVIIGYGPGRIFNDEPEAYKQKNGNLAFVVAVDDTVVYVDLNQDGLPDPFDMNGNSRYTDRDVWGVLEWDEPTSALGVPLAAGQVLRVGDPFDGRLRGARIYTRDLDEHIAVAWGQDPCSAWWDAYLDLGYTVLSSPVPRLNKDAKLAEDLDATEDVSPGDIVTYTLVLYNNGQSSMNQVWLTDTLPYTDSVFLTPLTISYPPPTSTVEYLMNDVWSETPLDGAEAFRVYWPQVGVNQVVTLTYAARILIDTLASELMNEAVVDSVNTDPVVADAELPVVRPDLAIQKWVDQSVIRFGQPFNYTIIVSNTDTHTGAAVGTQIWDVLPPGVSYVTGTLDVEWMVAVPVSTSEEVSRTAFFHGVYADNFDTDSRDGSTGYAGSDGSLEWILPWEEVNDDINNDPGQGSVQVWEQESTALSDPAYVRMGELAGADTTGIVRVLDLSEFISPTVRFHRAGSSGIIGEYLLRVEGSEVTGSRDTYEGEYGFVEFPLSPADFTLPSAVPLALVVENMTDDDVYRFDNFAVFEGQPEREEIATIWSEYTYLETRSATGRDPIEYYGSTGYMVITDSLYLPAQGAMTVTFSAVLAPPFSITDTLYLTNTAYTRADNRPETLTDTAVVSVLTNTVDLEIVKLASPDHVIKADSRTLTYTLVYTNHGPMDAQEVWVTDTLPNEVTFAPPVVSQPDGWDGPYVGTGTPVTLGWYTPTLAAYQSGRFVFTVTVQEDFTGIITNTVRITTTTPESDETNNQDDKPTGIDTLADVTIVKTGEPDWVVEGDTIVYTLVYTNLGPNEALSVVVSDTLIPEIVFESADPEPDREQGGALWWELGMLGVGETGTIVMTATVADGVRAPFVNWAYISTTTPEPEDQAPNSDDDPTDVYQETNVAISKVGSPDAVAWGDVLTYTLVYTNYGPAVAYDVVVSDTVIPELSFNTSSPLPTSFVDNVLQWEVGNLAPGQSGTITMFMTVTDKAITVFTNTVQIWTTTPETTEEDNWADDPTEVFADVTITKTVGAPWRWPETEGPFSYTIECKNYGPGIARNVVVLDPLPSELIYASAQPAPVSQTPELRWELGDLLPNEIRVITLYVTVREGTQKVETIHNVAWISTETPEPPDQEPNQGDSLTAIELLYFKVEAVPDAVWVKWMTVVEIDTLGYSVYRSESDRWEDAIPVAYRPAIRPGIEYAYKDRSVSPGVTYYYWLVEEENLGRRTWYGPREITALPLPYRAYLWFVGSSQAVGVATSDSNE